MAIILAWLAFIIVCLILKNAYSKYWDKNLKVNISFEKKEVSMGDNCFINESIENRKWLPLPIITIKFKLDRSIKYNVEENSNITDYNYRCDSMAVLPYQMCTRKFLVSFNKRGVYNLNNLSIISTDIFYDNILEKNILQNSEIYVYPDYFKESTFKLAEEKIMGKYISLKTIIEDPFELRGIRDYYNTDSMNKINWKLSARNGKLKVNQFYQTNEINVCILLDIKRDIAHYNENLAEKSISLVRNCVEKLVYLHIPVSLISNGNNIKSHKYTKIDSGATKQHYIRILRGLAEIDSKSCEFDIEKLIKDSIINKNTMFILISINQNENMINEYKNIAGNYGISLMIIEKDEKHLLKSSKNLDISYLEV